MTVVGFSKKQLEVRDWWQGDDEILIGYGSVRSGKTFSMFFWFVMWAISQFADSDCKEFTILGQSQTSLLRNVITPFMNIMNASPWAKKNGISTRVNKSEWVFYVVYRGVQYSFYMFGAGKKGDELKIPGFTSNGTYVNEATNTIEPAFIVAQQRCETIPRARHWLECNPKHPGHWIYKNLILQDDLEPDEPRKPVKVLKFMLEDNPVMTPEMIKKTHQRYGGIFYRRNVLAEWAIASGIIYPMFAEEPKKFQVPDKMRDKKTGRLLLPRGTQVNIGCDWGNTKSFVATALLPPARGLIALASELHKSENMTIVDVENAVVKFVAKITDLYGPVSCVYCDHDNVIINSVRVALRKAGINTVVKKAAKPPINERISCTDALISHNSFMYVAGECNTLEEALCSAVWDPDSVDERLDEDEDWNHTLDGFEYSFSPFIYQFSNQLAAT